jgi:hypothetical protein
MPVMNEERIAELLGKLDRPPAEWEDAAREIPRALRDGPALGEQHPAHDESGAKTD